MGSIGWPELLILLAVVLVLFGTTRLAGLGKASGRAIREFKEETKGLNEKDAASAAQPQQPAPQQVAPPQPYPPQQSAPAQPYPAPQPQAQQPYPPQPYPAQQPPQASQPSQPPQGQVYDAEVVDPGEPNPR